MDGEQPHEQNPLIRNQIVDESQIAAHPRLPWMVVSYVPAKGDVAELDHRPMFFMHHIGLPDEPTLEDLFEFSRDRFEFQDPRVTEATVFGVPALRVRADTADGAKILYIGF